MDKLTELLMDNEVPHFEVYDYDGCAGDDVPEDYEVVFWTEHDSAECVAEFKEEDDANAFVEKLNSLGVKGRGIRASDLKGIKVNEDVGDVVNNINNHLDYIHEEYKDLDNG